VAAVLLTAALVGLANPASAAFTSRTANPGNTFAAGTIGVTLTDGNNTAMYSAVANLKPGDAPLTRCVTVTNTGTIPLQLKLYSGTTTGAGLGTDLNLSIPRGSFGTPPAYRTAPPSPRRAWSTPARWHPSLPPRRAKSPTAAE